MKQDQNYHVRHLLRRRGKVASVRVNALDDATGLQNMLRAHVAYLDHLTATAGDRNYRTDFTTWYLTHRPKGERREQHAYRN